MMSPEVRRQNILEHEAELRWLRRARREIVQRIDELERILSGTYGVKHG